MLCEIHAVLLVTNLIKHTCFVVINASLNELAVNTHLSHTSWPHNRLFLTKNVIRVFYKFISSDIDLPSNKYIQSTPDNSNLQGKLKKVRVIGGSSYRELEENSRE